MVSSVYSHSVPGVSEARACHQSWHQDSQHVDPDTAQIASSNPAVCVDLICITIMTSAFSVLKFVLLQLYFPNIYDIKYLMKFCGNLHGGLNKLAESLDVKRLGPQHQVIPFAPRGASSASCFALWGPRCRTTALSEGSFSLGPFIVELDKLRTAQILLSTQFSQSDWRSSRTIPNLRDCSASDKQRYCPYCARACLEPNGFG